ncbi:MAG: methyltransferase domain-containing protein [Pirellulaceae bacterium]
MSLARTLEPELMDDPQESAAYDAMDHSEVNRKFVSDFLLACGIVDHAPIQVVDLGTGTALIPIELCRQHAGCTVVANDAAESMLAIARRNTCEAGMADRITLHHGDSKQLDFANGSFGYAISNSLMHHLAEPTVAIAEMLRITQPGGQLFVRDLMRPNSTAELEALVQTYAGRETPFNQQLLRQSLHAALTLEEIRDLVQSYGFDATTAQATSDRHWTCVLAIKTAK